MQNLHTPLINPTWDELVAADPLIAFSWYLSGRKNVLLHVADEIAMNLDTGFDEAHINMGAVERAESLMWLWILGAYEVIRTMQQSQSCFAARVHKPLANLKSKLAVVRMPATKMEKRGKKEPVTSNRSPSGIDFDNKDLLLGDPDTPMLSARSLLSEFRNFVDSLEPCDVLQTHEEAYSA